MAVYLIQNNQTGNVKIGSSDKVPQRLATLQAASPQKLQLLKIYTDCDIHDEKYLHRHFAKSRVFGEWFQADILTGDQIDTAIKAAIKNRNPNHRVFVTIGLPKRIAKLLTLEASDNKRSRRAQIELVLEKHADKYSKKKESPAE